MTRKECLDAAAACVLKDRASQYGGPEDNFGRIAKLWSTYTGTVLDGIDVAMMMALLKVARIRNNKSYEDGYIDLAGYAACGAELAGAEKAREDATRRWGAEYKKLRAEAEGNAKAEGCEEPAYNPDADVVGGVVTLAWPRGKVLEKLYASGRVEKCAEGCEELVQKDAPQTPAELCRHIVDCNPATYGHPHKPTGEELAEMAQEDAHG